MLRDFLPYNDMDKKNYYVLRWFSIIRFSRFHEYSKKVI